MGNGPNEPVQFTRGDAVRLGNIEIKHDDLHGKIDSIIERLDAFHKAHNSLKSKVDANTRFRRVLVKVSAWAIPSSATCVAVAKALGWF